MIRINWRQVRSVALLKRFLFVIGMVISYQTGLFCQDANQRFTKITSDQGLSQNAVDCILQDSRGFMWFGTWNGLNRFDGYNFKIYETRAGLSSNYIFSICEDKDGDLWVGTDNGLNKFEFRTNRFTAFLHNPKDSNSISGNGINDVVCDKDGIIWAGTYTQGINRIEKKNGRYKFSNFLHDPNIPWSISNNSINTLYVDKKGNLWVGTHVGLNKLNKKTGRFISYLHHPSDDSSLTHNAVLSIYEDHLGVLWVGTWFGLNRLNEATGKFTRYYYNLFDPHSISHTIIRAINEDSNGNLIIGTLNGLNKYNRKTDNFYRFPTKTNDDYSLNNELINCIATDKQGNLWIGTDKGGINTYNINQKPFGHIALDPTNKNSINNNTINSIYHEPSTLWIGTAGSGLNRLEIATGKYYHYLRSPNNDNSISGDFITSIKRDKNKNLWLGTWGNGLNRLVSMEGNGTFERFVPSDLPGSITNVFISSLWEDDNFIVVGGRDGLELMDKQKKTFIRVVHNTKRGNSINDVGCILKDKNGNYWFGTRSGLFRCKADKLGPELNDTDITSYYNIPGKPASLPGNHIISLCEDQQGNIWVGTFGNGISKLQTNGDGNITFTNYNDRQGLSNNVVYSILEDKKGRLWMSTDFGLSKFDPHTLEFKNYYVADGLQDNQFYWLAACKSSDGQMYFGGIKGINYFYPESIRNNTITPLVSITDLKIFNQSVNVGLWNNQKVILQEDISGTSEITLSYKENIFSFEFSALNYFLPEKNKYAYKMVGVDKDWVYVPSSQRLAVYTNLKGGHYTFMVKAANSDGVWSNSITKLKVTITPPFWETLWFKILMVFVFAVILTFYFRYRTKRLELQKKILGAKVKERTLVIEEQKEKLKLQAQHLQESNMQLAIRQEVIEGQKNQLEKQNHEISVQRDELIEMNKRVQLANQLKLRFFTNISHEFRTPLTLILGPLEKLISTWEGSPATLNTLQLINRNAKRLLQLINQLMEFRKIETGKLELRVSQGNITKFLQNIFTSFQQLAHQKKIKYSYKPSPNKGEQWFDHEKLENILYNLLSNAFKFTPEGGEISLSFSFIKKGNENNSPSKSHEKEKQPRTYLEIKVADTGVGIHQEHIDLIFKQFYQVNSPENLKVRGSGIGLSLTRELVRAHHGQISVKSEQGKGSVFTLLIPYQKENYAAQEFMEQSTFNKNASNQLLVPTVEEINAPEENKTSVNITSSKKPLIVVAEDNPDLLSFITESLETDFSTISTRNGTEAYEMAKIHSPELVLSDIMMPEMDGLELCTRIKENLLTSHIPVVLLTARSAIENWIQGLETGADDYVPKPFDINLLLAKLKNIIESRRKLKAYFGKELSPDPSVIATSSADEQFMQKALQIVEENYTDPNFGVEEFINKMCVSRSLLHKKLSVLTDQSAGDFITSIRLKKSVQLFQHSNKNISEIAYEVGFNDPKYFSRTFRKHFGSAPSEYFNI